MVSMESIMKALDLQELYRKLNKNYFDNQLPEISINLQPASYFNKKRWGKNTLGKRTVAITLFEAGKPICMVLKKYANRSYSDIKLDMLHEMIHIKHPEADCGENSKIFKKELRRLVRLGALDDIF